jgi:hypothetical protein
MQNYSLVYSPAYNLHLKLSKEGESKGITSGLSVLELPLTVSAM